MKKLLLFIIALVTVLQVTSFAGVHRRIDRSSYILPNESNYGINVSVTHHNPYPSFTLAPAGDYGIGPEILTNLDGYYDYGTNGDCRHSIQVDPTNPLNITVIYTTCDSADANTSTVASRRTKCSFSSDGGNTWVDNGPVPFDIRSGFGDLFLKPTGEAVISFHAVIPSVLASQLAVDVAPQAGTFTNYPATTVPTCIWPEPARFSNGNIMLVGNTNVTTAPDSLCWCVFNGTTIGAWHNIIAYTAFVSNQRWCTQTGSSDAFVVSNPISAADTLDGSNWIRGFKSTDNGATFSSAQRIYSPRANATDTDYTFFGQDLSFKPGTNNWYFVFNSLGNSTFHRARLYMVTSASSTPVLICDSTVVPALWQGLNNLPGGTARTFAGVCGIDHPSLGWSADGNILYCSYSVAGNDTGAAGWNTRDIYYQFSTNNGATWSAAIQITSTPLFDEGYASVSTWNPGNSPGTYELYMVYMKDPGDGPTSFNASQFAAPVSHNHQIFRKITEATNPIGITNHGNQIPKVFSMSQNYPNPFNPSTLINFSVPKTSYVSIKVYDIMGRLVTTLVNGTLEAGNKTVDFNGTNFASGIYYYTITAGDFKDTKKMVLIK